jgi:NADPH2:quinone reductase
MRAIQVNEFGGPEVLVAAEVEEPVGDEWGVVIEVDAAGVNYADTHQIENSYLSTTQLPLVPGAEVVGRDPDGRRVVALLAGGGYAERALAPKALCWEVPENVSDGAALAAVLQGSTAWHLLRTSAHLAPGESVVVHAAGGGVGSLAVQLAKKWAAGRVIATASSQDKRDLALELGADVAIDSRSDDLNAALREANEGRKVDVILEMQGGRSIEQGLHALAPFGRMIIYGMASREPAAPVEPGMLLSRSRALIGFWLAHCIQRPGMLDEAVNGLLTMFASGELRAIEGGEYPLDEARRAHEDLLARRTTGKLVLRP